MEDASTLTTFVEIALQAPEVCLRQTAAVVVRRKFADMLKAQPAELVAQVKAHMLNALTTEQAKVVRKALANLVIVIAKGETTKWLELLNYIDNNSTHDELEKRLDGAYILMVLMEESSELFDGF